MQKISKRVMSWLLTLAIIVSMIPGALAASNNTSERHKVATKLSNQAEDYYTGANSIDNLYKLSGNSSGKSYDSMDSDLYRQLNNLMESTMTRSVSYDSLTGHWETTDADSRGNKPVLFYSDVSGSYNREHVWPKSRGSFYQSYAGADLHHLRPTDNTVNSTRNNMTMGEVRSSGRAYSTYNHGGKPVLYYTGGGDSDLVEINNNIKGDVARIFLYVYVRWGEPNLFEDVLEGKLPPPRGGSDKGGNNGLRVIDNLDTLLMWCESDPVDEWEMTRNDLTQNIQGNRNVFIDYPELAWKLFNEPVPAGMPTPSGGAGTVEPDHIVTPATNNAAWGTVEKTSASRITATPADGYYVEGFTVEPAGAATIIQSGTMFTIKGTTANCTLTVRFAAKVQCSVSYAVPEGVSVNNGPSKGWLGESITLPTVSGTPAENSKGYTFVGWVDESVTATTEVSKFTICAPGKDYPLIKAQTKLYALYSYRVEDGTGGDPNTFTKVTASQSDWTGEYVMASKNAAYVHLANGQNVGGAAYTSAIALAQTGITKDGTTLTNVTDNYIIIFNRLTDGSYTMQLKGAATPTYLSYTGGNSLTTATSADEVGAQWKLEFNGSTIIVQNANTAGRYLRYNPGGFFRCYEKNQEDLEFYAATGEAFTTYYLTLGEGTTPPPIPANIDYAVPDGVTVVSGPTTGVVGQPITLPNVIGTPSDTTKTYTFAGWVEKKIDDTTTRPAIYAPGAAYTVKAAATKLYALFTYTTTEVGGGTDAYTLVKDAAGLNANDKVVVVSKNEDKLNNRNSYFAMSTDYNSKSENNRKAVAVTISGETITINDKVAVLTLENGVETKPGTFAFKTADGKYLEVTGMAADPGKGNWIVNGDKTENASWKIEMTDGAAIVTAQGDKTANIMRYNPNLKFGSTTEVNGDSIFSAYGPESSVKGEATNIVLYKLTTGSGGTVEVTHYLTLAEPPEPIKLPVPVPTPAGGSTVESGAKITFAVFTGAKAVYKTTEAGGFVDVPDGGVTITGNGGDTVKLWVKATKAGMGDSDVAELKYTIKNTGTTPGTGGSGGGAVTPATPTVKAEDVKVNDGTAEIKLPSVGARLDDAANKKALSANATKPIAITGGGLNIIIPAGALSAGADVNALLVNPKASGGVIRVTKSDGTTAILPIAIVSGGQAAYVANIPGKYEVVDNTKTFPDGNNHWAQSAIGFVSARELFKGDSTGAFHPEQPMTRGMLATVLARMDGGKTAAGTPFADVSGNSWYAKEIAWAAQGALVEGDGENFAPDADLTREQLCVILIRYLDYSGFTLAKTTPMGSFSDLGSVSPWAKDAVERAVKAGLIDGKTGGLLDPHGKATRAEIATILQRLVEGVLK